MYFWMIASFLLLCPFWGRAMTWSTPHTIFSSPSIDGAFPQISLYISAAAADAVWIGAGEVSALYSSTFNGASWTPPTVIAENVASKLSLGREGRGDAVAVWSRIDGARTLIYGARNGGSGWSSHMLIGNSSGADDALGLKAAGSESATAISWHSGGRLLGATYTEGFASPSYFLSEEGLVVIASALGPDQAVFSASSGVYSTFFNPLALPMSPADMLVFPFSAEPFSLALDKEKKNGHFFVLQDNKTWFFTSQMGLEPPFKKQTIVVAKEPVVDVKICSSPVGDLAAAIWELESGIVQAAFFDGAQWGRLVTFSTNGRAPDLIFNPVSYHIVAVWADLTAGGEANTIRVAEFDRVRWSSPFALSSPGADVNCPRLSVNLQGDVMAIWTRKETAEDRYKVEAAIGS